MATTIAPNIMLKDCCNIHVTSFIIKNSSISYLDKSEEGGERGEK
jgi:hypothetical protein